MNALLVQLAKVLVPWLIQEVIKCTKTKADDTLLEAVKEGLKHHGEGK